MAIGDIGLFLPSEAAYSRPGTYEQSLRAEAVKRGAWLASLDQFYAQLDETQRQFDITAAFKEKALGFEKEAAEAEMAYKYKTLDTEEALRSRQLDIEERKVDTLDRSTALGRSSEDKALDFLKSWSSGGSSNDSWMIGGAQGSTNRFLDYTGGKLVPSTGIAPPSGEVEWDLY